MTFWFLVSGVFINRLGSFLYIFLAYYLTVKRGLSIEQTGIVASVYAGGSMLSGPLGGWAADYIGRRKAMVLATCLGALGMLCFGLASSYFNILLAAFFLGVVGDLYRPAMAAAISDLVPSEDRVRAFGWSYWAANLGFSIAAVVGGFLSENHFSLLFFLDAGTTLLFGMLVLFFVPDIKYEKQLNPKITTKKRAPFYAPYLNKTLLVFIGIQLLLEFLMQQSIVAFPLDVAAHAIPIRVVGYVNALNAVLIVFVQPFLQRILPKFRRPRVLAASALALGIGQYLTIVSIFLFSSVYLNHTNWTLTKGLLLIVAMLPTVIWTIGEILMFAMVPPTLADLAPEHLRGSSQGAYQLIVSSSMLLAPLYGTFVLHRYGSHTLWTSCLLIGFVGAALHLIFRPSNAPKPLITPIHKEQETNDAQGEIELP